MHYRALTLSALAASTYASVPLRKSLSFGPQHQHARFDTTPPAGAQSFGSTDKHHYEIAKEYVRDVLGHPEHTYVVREDSYKDSITGVEHVYLRQVLRGVPVADGDINLNILDGRVISYGDSFYRGPAVKPNHDVDTVAGDDTQDHAHYCSQLRSSLYAHLQSGAQQPLSIPTPSPHAHHLTKLYEHNCLHLHSLDPNHPHLQAAGDQSDVYTAVLYFVAAAHPSSKVASSILQNFDTLREAITSTSIAHLSGGPPTELLYNVPYTESPVKAHITYIQTPCGEESCKDGASSRLNLVWKLEVEMKDNWYEAYMDFVRPSRIISVVDWVSDASPHATTAKKCWPAPPEDLYPIPKTPKTDANGVREAVYKVWPWGVNDPTEGKREIVATPYDKVASPLGWHAIPSKNNPSDESPWLHSFLSRSASSSDEVICNFTTTWGNNVQAQENWEGNSAWIENYRPNVDSNGTYIYKWGASGKHEGVSIDPKSYIDLAVLQMFYTVNMVHDLYYRYGFDEAAGNFQNHNFGRGGRENDAVIAHAQDGSGYNNANFATPPDGQRGKMRMYVWDTATPFRDGDLEAGIVIHELSHGLSTRLTGGPMNSRCLGWGESGGMGEGWGDFLATTVRSTKNYSDYSMGAWASNREKGIRNYKYSLNMTINPSTYKTLDGPGYWGVHAIGEVWAQILWVVEQRLIAIHGFSETLYPPPPHANGSIPSPNDFYRSDKEKAVPKHGNTLMVQLVITAMKLQPCSPSFFDARDAIIQADEVLTGGENLCELWQEFASRGLGPAAKLRGGTPWGGGIRKEDYEPPVKCGGKDKEPEDDE